MDADMVPCEETKLPPAEEIRAGVFVNPFGNFHDPSSPLWLHKLVFATKDGGRSHLGVIVGVRLETPAELSIFGASNLGSFHVESTALLEWHGEERHDLMKECEEFTRLVVQILHNRKPILSPFFHYTVPLLSEGMEIDWDLLRRPLSPISSLTSVRPGMQIYVPSRRMEVSRYFEVISHRKDLSMQSPPLPMSYPNTAKRFQTYEVFFIVVRGIASVRCNQALDRPVTWSSPIPTSNFSKCERCIDRPATRAWTSSQRTRRLTPSTETFCRYPPATRAIFLCAFLKI
jgi:hypothetical protein